MAELILEVAFNKFPKDQNIQQLLLMTYLENDPPHQGFSVFEKVHKDRTLISQIFYPFYPRNPCHPRST